ncbi:MAG TPA: Crp/Fnr family transcriptional regulator [Actinomycetota bacterium]|nr:Crp/Fnr family transcriptional regulator [Actinomycetota bacterium]
MTGEVEDFVSLLQAAGDGSRPTGIRRRYPRGTTLLNKGDRSERIVVVVSGRAKVSYLTDGGREVLLAIRGPGDLLGELAALDGEAFSATVTALEDVEAFSMTVDEFRAVLEEEPGVALTLFKSLSRKLRDADRKRVEFAAFDSLGRVTSRLVELAEDFGEHTPEGIRIALSLTQDELAGWTGASREAVAKALQTLRSRDLIETHRRGVTVKDLDALRARIK